MWALYIFPMKNTPISPTEEEPAAEATDDYEIGRGKPPRHAGFQKDRSGNPKGRPKGSKNLATLLNQALDEKVYVTEDGVRRRVTKRELVIKQLVNKSATADLRAIKQLTDIVERVEPRTGGCSRGRTARLKPQRGRGGPVQRVSMTTRRAAAAATRATMPGSTACGQRSCGRWNSRLLPTRVR